MRKFAIIAIQAALVLSLSGCGAWRNVQYADDMYDVHNQIAIANRQKAEAELAKAQYEAQQAMYEAALAQQKAEAAKQEAEGGSGSATAYNVYDSVLADTYESAYARRLYGFSSPTYRMPSSYYTWRYSDAFTYASAYDPAFYNVMVSGDMVWVEPKYITSMFGSWGAAVVPTYGWYYGWSNPYYWGYPYRYNYGWNWYYSWNNPYYWGWGYPYYPYHHHHHPHRPSQRPPYAGSGSVGNTGHHYRPGNTVGRNPGASRPGDRGGQTIAPPANGRVTAPVKAISPTKVSPTSPYRGKGVTAAPSGKTPTPYRGGSAPSNKKVVVPSEKVKNSTTTTNKTYKSSSYSATPTYRSSSVSSSFRGSSSPSYSSSPSHSSGGNSRGR